MATWGDGILEDDDAQEVYDEYCRLYNEGKDHAAIRKKLERAWGSTSDSDDGPIFWLALAHAQWDCDGLDPDVYGRVVDIAQRGLGLERWQEAGARALAKRRRIIASFVKKIQQRKRKPKARRPTQKAKALFQRGDCLAIRLSDGTFGAAVVIHANNRHRTIGFNQIVFLDYHGDSAPLMNVFTRRRWLKGKSKRPIARTCLARSSRRDRDNIQLVGHVELTERDPTFELSVATGSWSGVVADLQRRLG